MMSSKKAEEKEMRLKGEKGITGALETSDLEDGIIEGRGVIEKIHEKMKHWMPKREYDCEQLKTTMTWVQREYESTQDLQIKKPLKEEILRCWRGQIKIWEEGLKEVRNEEKERKLRVKEMVERGKIKGTWDVHEYELEVSEKKWIALGWNRMKEGWIMHQKYGWIMSDEDVELIKRVWGSWQEREFGFWDLESKGQLKSYWIEMWMDPLVRVRAQRKELEGELQEHHLKNWEQWILIVGNKTRVKEEWFRMFERLEDGFDRIRMGEGVRIEKAGESFKYSAEYEETIFARALRMGWGGLIQEWSDMAKVCPKWNQKWGMWVQEWREEFKNDEKNSHAWKSRKRKEECELKGQEQEAAGEEIWKESWANEYVFGKSIKEQWEDALRWMWIHGIRSRSLLDWEKEVGWRGLNPKHESQRMNQEWWRCATLSLIRGENLDERQKNLWKEGVWRGWLNEAYDGAIWGANMAVGNQRVTKQEGSGWAWGADIKKLDRLHEARKMVLKRASQEWILEGNGSARERQGQEWIKRWIDAKLSVDGNQRVEIKWGTWDEEWWDALEAIDEAFESLPKEDRMNQARVVLQWKRMISQLWLKKTSQDVSPEIRSQVQAVYEKLENLERQWDEKGLDGAPLGEILLKFKHDMIKECEQERRGWSINEEVEYLKGFKINRKKAYWKTSGVGFEKDEEGRWVFRKGWKEEIKKDWKDQVRNWEFSERNAEELWKIWESSGADVAQTMEDILREEVGWREGLMGCRFMIQKLEEQWLKNGKEQEVQKWIEQYERWGGAPWIRACSLWKGRLNKRKNRSESKVRLEAYLEDQILKANLKETLKMELRSDKEAGRERFESDEKEKTNIKRI